jgi:manganese-transporting P-type ATPase
MKSPTLFPQHKKFKAEIQNLKNSQVVQTTYHTKLYTMSDHDIPVEGFKTPGRLYKASSPRRMIIMSIFVALYAIVLPYCWSTAGEPRAAAAIAAQEKADEKWEQYSNGNFTADEKKEYDFTALTKGIKTTDDEVKSMKPSQILEDEVASFGEQSTDKSSGGMFSGWFGPSKEQKRAEAEQEKLIKQFNEKSADGPMSLPPSYLPSAWACLALFSTISLHALFYLMCYWQVKFKALTLYTNSNKVDNDTYVVITPPENRGKAEFVPIKYSKLNEQLQVEFQRQIYVYTPSIKLGAVGSARFPNGVFSLLTCPIDKPLEFYSKSYGIRTQADVANILDRWGKNHLSIQRPSFLQMLKIQLLSPLAIFQVFCAMLWLLDEYWSYTVFTLISVVVMEATTVFQRSRTQGMLGGMAPQASPIFVFRCDKWELVTTKDILPGDIISVAFKAQRVKKKEIAIPIGTAADGTTPTDSANANAAAAPETPADTGFQQDTTTDALVPCDCLLISGNAVVNESSLTGESVPQMKEAIVYDNNNGNGDVNVNLDMQGLHRVHVLFSGTSVVTVDNGNDDNDNNNNSKGSNSNSKNDSIKRIPGAPDGGATAYALRTGFSSSQGTLVQMIEFSQQTVTGDLRETGYALLLLLCFALAAAAYVLKEGLEKKEKTTHELLLKCVIIITSVVPRQFPMQMAMAVNMALMALTKGGIFCTEQHRVPLAGKITHCLFDKTGTLTTDQLVPVGVVNADKRIHHQDSVPGTVNIKESNHEVAMILAGCHSLVEVEGIDGETTLAGDPIELAAIKGVEWDWNSSKGAATPGVYNFLEKALKRVENNITEATKHLSNPQVKAKVQEDITQFQKQAKILSTKIHDAKGKARLSQFSAIKIIARHHFSSALQRMSVITKCTGQDGEIEWYSLVKGSPEAVCKLFTNGSEPNWYSVTYNSMARKGLRVLALAYRRLDDHININETSAMNLSREECENNLIFGGFIAFECKIRADSGIVIKSLTDSHHEVSMLTGDALLTSLHVAKEVHICDKKKGCLTLNTDNKDQHKWILDREPGEIEKTNKEIILNLDNIPLLAKEYNLITTENDFLNVINSTGGDNSLLWKQCGNIRVFARMSPHGKASIIKNIQDSSEDNCVLMCGDGGNDVGALKQADVGMALLAGHANANTTDAPIEESSETAVMTSDKDSSGGNAEDALNKHTEKLKQRAEEINKLRAEHMKVFQAQYQKRQQELLQEKVKELTAKGDYMGMWTAMKGGAMDVKNAMNAENARFMAKHGQVWDAKKDGENDESTGGMDLASMMDDAGGAAGLPMIRPGDASVAAPFTSRTPSVRAVIDLIRQGRCTLLSALMQQQIMMLESIIAAYTLSALSLHNARSSERQMMASSWLIMTAAVAFSYSTPLDHMHPLRPIRSLFHPAIFLSTMGQAIIHILCMNYAVNMATDHMGPEGMQEVTEFFRKAKSKEILAVDLCDEDDMMCQFQAYWTAPFLPNLLNTTVFLVETAQMISVFFANYKGRPWMKGMLENHALFLSVFLCIGGVVVASWEMVPQLNEMIQLAPFPDDVFRYKVVGLVMATIAGTFIWDRLCTMIFAPKIAGAMRKEITDTKLADLVPVAMTLLKVIAGVAVLGTGNLMLGAGLWWYFRKVSATPATTPATKKK